MRLWSLHPCYLDAKGLVALWREALLAQNVLLGKTKGYRNHPQLNRFKACSDPATAIATYLTHIADEADRRGYHFNKKKIIKKCCMHKIDVTSGQLEYEIKHLKNKLRRRDPGLYKRLKSVKRLETHPMFCKVKGDIEDWEVT